MPGTFLNQSACVIGGVLLSAHTWAEWRLGVEAGVFKPASNKVEIPNDGRGDRFSITDLGNVCRSLTARRVCSIRPCASTGAFPEGDPVDARYQFTSYRPRYLDHWKEPGRWSLDFGGTLFVRDVS